MSANRERFAGAVKAVGGTAYLLRGGERTPFTASVQPRPVSGGPDCDPLGTGSVQLYHLYAPAEGSGSLLAAGDAVEWLDATYYVIQAEAYTLGGEILYDRAVLRKGAGHE